MPACGGPVRSLGIGGCWGPGEPPVARLALSGKMPSVNRAWTLKADEIVALPLDELALIVLRDACGCLCHSVPRSVSSVAQLSDAYSNARHTSEDLLDCLAAVWAWCGGAGVES
jgi:hypothetical protein